MGAVAQSAIAAPTVSISSPAANANFGAPARIAITATATPSSGTSITKVEFFRGGSTLIGTATTSPYTVTWNSVAVGNYSLTAKATDSAGGTKTSSAVAITVKANVVPTVSISSPAASANFGAPATITITATATDTDGTIAKIDFFNGATLLGTATTSPYKFTWTNVAIGNYSLTAKATDNSGGVKTSTAVAITVKTNVVPTVSISSPAANATFTTPASIPITATASDTDGTIAKVEFFNGATLLGTTTTSPYAFTWTGVAAGSYALTAKATDNSGGVKTSVAVAISVRTPPTVNITVPANNASFIAPASIPITASATPAGSATISKVDFLKGATLLGTKTVAPYTFTWTGVAVGSYSLTAKATDSNGLATTSAPIAVTVGANPPPTVSITAPASNASFAAPASVAITASATAASGLTISKVDFYSGATLLGTKTTSPYIFNWTGVAAGSYSLTAKATDSAGAITTAAAVPITVTPPIARPTVSITSPISGATFNGPATILITATAAATAGGASISKVDFYNDSTFLGTSSSAPYSYNWTNVPAGEFLLSAKATDSLTVTGTSWPIYAIVDGADSCTTTPPLAANDSESKMAALGNLPMTFEINEGQANPDVRFQARGSNYQLFLTSTERVFALQGAQSAPQGNPAVHSPALDAKGVAVRMRFVGANPNAVVTGVDPVATKSNYLIGSDRTAWHANIPHFAKVRYEGLYPGIDEVYYGTQGKLEYDLVVAPRANPHTVRFAVDGIDGMSVDLNGDLLLDTKLGTLVQKSPVAYQDIDGQRRAVKAQYQILAANEVAFLLGDYDTSHPLVIDPVLGYSTFVGGANSDSRATGIAISRCGETFITGWTRATDYPVTAGAFDPSAVPNSQMGFVSKLNQAGPPCCIPPLSRDR